MAKGWGGARRSERQGRWRGNDSGGGCEGLWGVGGGAEEYHTRDATSSTINTTRVTSFITRWAGSICATLYPLITRRGASGRHHLNDFITVYIRSWGRGATAPTAWTHTSGVAEGTAGSGDSG